MTKREMTKYELQLAVEELKGEISEQNKTILQMRGENNKLQFQVEQSTNLPQRKVRALERIADSLGEIVSYMTDCGIMVALCTSRGTGELHPIHVMPVTKEDVEEAKEKATDC